MPPPNVALQYFGIDKPVLPYKSNTSVVDESPHWVPGSQNAMATITGWVEKRPGFNNPIESLLTAIPGIIVRLFTWRRWAGTETNAGAFYVMACATTFDTSTVWKYQEGTDTSFVLIWTDTTSAQPYDFIVSNNFCYFGNETIQTNNRKFDGTLVTQWGIFAPSSPPTFQLTAGSLPNGLTFSASTGAITGTPTTPGIASLTFSVSDVAGGSSSQVISLTIGPSGLTWQTAAGALPIATSGVAYSTTVAVSGGTGPYTFAVQSGSLPTGLSLAPSTGVISGTPSTNINYAFTLSATDSLGAIVSRGFSIFVSSATITLSPHSFTAPYGTFMNLVAASGGTAPYTFVVVGGSLPPGINGATSSPNFILSGIAPMSGAYSFTLQATDSAGVVNQTLITFSITGTSLTILSMTMPNAQVGVPYSFTPATSGGTMPFTWIIMAGSITAQTGYVYGQTFTSSYGHESAMSQLSLNTGLFTDSDVDVTVTASTDPQVTGINIYRTSDGGTATPSSMFLVVSLSNTNQSYIDSTVDVNLSTQTGPALYVNDPPQPISGFVWSNGRIWGKRASKSWFTGNEEITNGIAEECMSDAINGNFYAWPSEVGGMAVTPEGVDIGLSEQYWQISGDALATFQKQILLSGGGVRAPINVISVGSTVFWIDTAKQVFSSSAGEIGEPIRPDLQNIDPMRTFLVYHKSKTFNLLVILDAANGILLTYDLDLSQWNTPWTVNGMSAIWSGEVTLGNIELIAAFTTGHVMKLTPGTFSDDQINPYADQLRSNMISISPGRGTSARNRAEVRQVKVYEMETNTTLQLDGSYAPNAPTEFYDIRDDDPILTDLSLWNDLSFNRTYMEYGNSRNARYIGSMRWVASGSDFSQQSSRVAFCANWDASTTYWRVYTFDVAWSTV